MIKRSNRLTKILILTLGISAFLNSCVKENINSFEESENNVIEPIEFQHITNSILRKSKSISQTLESLGPINQKSASANQIIYSDSYGFAIDTENALLNNNGSRKTYTFNVFREHGDETILENLVIDIDTISNTVKQLLITYPKIADGYDYQYMTVTEISDNSLIPTRNYGCYEVWQYESPRTYDFACKSKEHVGADQLDACKHKTPPDAPYTVTTSPGGWVTVQNCPPGSDELIYGDCTGCIDGNGMYGGNGSNGNTGPGSNTEPYEPIDIYEVEFDNFIDNDLSPEQHSWITNSANWRIRKEIGIFLKSNTTGLIFSEEIKALAELAIEGLMSYNSTDYPGINDDLPFNWWNDQNFIENSIILGVDDEGISDLSYAEKRLVVLYPLQALIIQANVDHAHTETENRFGFSARNDKSDAFRHSFFNAMNSNDAGDNVARLFSTAHESEVPVNLALEVLMDLHNNDKGHTIGSDASFFISDQDLSNSVNIELLAGNLFYLSPLGPVIPPNFGINSSTQLTPTNQ